MNEGVDLKDKSIKELVDRLNEINKEKDKLDIEIIVLNDEYDKIVKELWDRIPSLKDDPNLQKVKVKEWCYVKNKG